MTYEEQVIRGAMARAGIPNRCALSDRADINDQTMRKRMRNPEMITIGELRRVAEVTQMTREEKLSVLEGEKIIKQEVTHE